MDRIFCLETEWDQTRHDIKKKSSVLPLLEFMEHADDIQLEYVFRQVATPMDFEYYIRHLENDSYNSYKMVYLCFHGSESALHFANKDQLNLLEFAKNHRGIFNKRNVHFGSCSTLNMNDDEIIEFKRLTSARMVSGYTKDVDFVDSFVFELWLLSEMMNHPDYAAKRFKPYVDKKMSFYVSQLGFVVY